jgi:hypothetical protein
MKEVNSKSKAIAIMYLYQIKDLLIKELTKWTGVEKENMQYDLKCVEEVIEYLS